MKGTPKATAVNKARETLNGVYATFIATPTEDNLWNLIDIARFYQQQSDRLRGKQ